MRIEHYLTLVLKSSFMMVQIPLADKESYNSSFSVPIWGNDEQASISYSHNT